MIRLGLISRIALLVIAIEVAAFSTLGWFYTDRFSTAAEERIRSRLHLVAQMIATDNLPLSILARRQLMSDLVGAPCLSGIVIGGGGRVIVSSDPTYLGQPADGLPGLDGRWLAESAPDEQVLAAGATITSVSHIHGPSGGASIYRVVLKISTTQLYAQKRAIALGGQAVAALFVLLSSIAIILMAQRVIARRVDACLAILKKVEDGALDARIAVSSRDELGQLQRGINSMITKVGALLGQHRRNEEEIRGLNHTLEHRVLERTAQLESANQELEAFAYSVSHDLRAPLRAIDGFSRILLEDYQASLDSEGQRLLSVVRDSTAKMGQLIDDILSFSRMGRREMAIGELDLGQLAQSVFDELQTERPGRSLRLEMGEMPTAWGDRAMIRQVLVNLLANAAKFTRTRAEGVIEVGGQSGSGENIYFVRDNGVGFDMQYADKLFGVFQRLHTSDEFEGTGIGLAIVKRIITRHGGWVAAEGAIDGGATMRFSLPHQGLAAPAEPALPAAAMSEP